MKISLLHPSLGRPEKAFQTYTECLKDASGEHEIEYILSLDRDDKSNYWILYNDSLLENNIACIIINENTCVVEATNHAAKESTGDILTYLSDDFKCPKNWDLLITERFKPFNTPLFQKFHVDVLTIPIMNRLLYYRLGYFWHPAYKSMFVDQDLYWTCRKSHWLLECPDLKFEHHHYSIGKAPKDQTYTRSDANWNSGKELS